MRAVRAVFAAPGLGLLVGLALVVRGPDTPPATPPAAVVPVVEALRAPAAGFARAVAPRAFRFPEDHGPHPAFRTEWWYYTGTLAAASGRSFGYQLTFFRFGLAADGAPRASAWATTEVWMAHFALTDVEGGRFVPAARFARGSAGLAGARAEPFRVWLEDWFAAGRTPETPTPSMRLRAADVGQAIDLELVPLKPPVLQGERGLSRKSAAAGAASYYYSLTRLATRGTVRLGDETFAVTGTSWMDREWSTSTLGEDQVGWDWFALALDDGRELMLYRLRRADGTPDPFSAGTLVERDGTARPLAAADVVVDVVERWTSAATGARYPSRWRLAVPREALALEVAPRVAAQEWVRPVRYWEGAVTARGTHAGRAITAEGYAELVGY